MEPPQKMPKIQKEKQWFKPFFEFDDFPLPKKYRDATSKSLSLGQSVENLGHTKHKLDTVFKESCSPLKNRNVINFNDENWMKNFDPVCVEDLAVHNKKVQEVEEWLKRACMNNTNDMLLVTGPVGCGKTATVRTLAVKNNIKITEWITPLDIEYPSEFGDYEFKVSQSKKFLEFIINSANFISLLDNNNCKLVLVEDFPNVFVRTPSEFTDVLQHYKQRAKSPIVFICSESHTDTKNTAFHLFSSNLKEKFNIQHIMFNSVTITGLRAALKRATDIITKKYTATYNIPTADIIESVVNTSGGDVRSAILNLHFASLKGSNRSLETSMIKEKEVKSKTVRRKKNVSNKFTSLGKDQTVSILHGVGRVLNPKESVDKDGRKSLFHSPSNIIEQFLSHPTSFVYFLQENYLPHFSCTYDVDKAASALSDGDYMLAEWREKICQEYGLYTSVAGLMLSNRNPVSAWNPVRGPRNMKVQCPSHHELPLMDPNNLYKDKVIVTDYLPYCKIISNQT